LGSRIEVEGAALYFEYYGNQAETVEGRSIPLGDRVFRLDRVRALRRLGADHPLELPCRDDRALAVGSLGHRQCLRGQDPRTDAADQRLVRPRGRGRGPSTRRGQRALRPRPRGRRALAGHPGVNQIVFTGSVPRASPSHGGGANVVPCVLELGGKSAAIVHDDADLEAFENDIRWGIFFNAGQVCSAMSRVIVHESRPCRNWSSAPSEDREIPVGRARHRAAGVRRQHGRDGQRGSATAPWHVRLRRRRARGVVTGGRL
jgi:aldehyde dehydrogenase (NAD+)